MDEVMRPGEDYFVEHALFEGSYFRNGKLCPGSRGYIAPFNGALGNAMEGKLFLGPEYGKLTRSFSERIEIQGLVAILPCGTEAAIYPCGSEPPLSKVQREAHLAEAKAKFLAKVDQLVTQVMVKIGASAAPDASTKLSDLLLDLSRRDSKAELLLAGYLQALEATSVLSPNEIKAIVAGVKELNLLGETYRAHLPKR